MIEKLFPNHIPEKIYYYLWYQKQKLLLQEYHRRVKIHYEWQWHDPISPPNSLTRENFYQFDSHIFNYRPPYGREVRRHTNIFNFRQPDHIIPEVWTPCNYYYTSKRINPSGFTYYICKSSYICRCANKFKVN